MRVETFAASSSGMRRLFIGLSVTLALSTAPFAQDADVRLRIVDADSSLPIPRVQITSASTVPLVPTFTDQRGEATVGVADAGRTIRIVKPGYVPQSVRLTTAERAVEIRLRRGAAVAGHVIDTFGAPVVDSQVVVADSSGAPPAPRVVRTDDLGEYRVGSLPAGTFTVSLGPGAAAAPGRPASAPATDAFPHTVILRRGDEVGGIDFTVPPRPSCRPPDVRPLAGNTSASIAGRVTTLAGRPLPCVEVVAFRGADRVASATTDADGRYTLTRLPAGAYPIEFRRPGFVTLQWGQEQAGQPGRLVRIRSGENARRIDAELARGGAITGTVTDEFSDPVENVTVRALALNQESERPIAVGAAAVQTDDRGRYRLFGLLPGRYLVATAATNEAPDRRTGKGYPPIYYPGAADIAGATAVDVVEERDRQWTDFWRVPTRVATISGTAVNSKNLPVTDRVILVASQRSGAVIAETHGAGVEGTDGAFTIHNVPPGDYVVQATSKRGEGESPEFGAQYVTVFDDDPPPVRIQTRPGIDLQGRLVQDGVPLVDPGRFAILAVPVNWDQTSLLAGAQAITPGDDGSLLLPGVTGPRRFVLTLSPSNWHLKSVRARGVDVTDEVMGFPIGGFGFLRDLEVVVSNKGATIDGEATEGSSPATDFSVVLFSSNPAHWFHHSRFIKTTRGNSAGKFRLDGIPDGEYFIAAVDPLNGSAGVAWERPEFLQALITGARRLRLRESDSRIVTLSVTHR